MTNEPATQFASAVASTIQGVAHLYRELDHLNQSLLQSLAAAPDPLRFLIGTPLEPSNRDELDRHIRDQYHFLLEPGEPVGEELDGAADGGDDDDDNGGENGRRMTHKATIDPATPYLAVSVILHDPVRPVQEPHIRYLVLRDCAVGAGAKAPPQRDTPIVIARHLAVRALRKLDLAGEHDPQRRILTAAKAQGRGGRHAESLISVRVPLPPKTKPLFELEGIESIDRLAQDMKAHWRAARDAL